MDTLLQDLRYAFRTLRKNPGFLIVAVLTLALGVGGNATIFAALRTALLAPLPYPDPDRIVAIDLTLTSPDGEITVNPWSFPKFETMRAAVTTVEHLGVRRGQLASIVGGNEPVRAYVEAATTEYFALFGANRVFGRPFRPDEDAAGAAPRVALLSHAFWIGRFGADSSVIGRTIRINGEPIEVVGIIAAPFRGVSNRVDLWVPVRTLPMLGNARVLERRWAHSFYAFARLKQGVTLDYARAEMAAVGRVVDQAHPDPDGGPAAWGAVAVALDDARTNGGSRTVLVVLGGAVALILLLACVNIASMLLARGAAREREIVIRFALGARRRRVLRLLMVESILLAAAGAALGLLAAVWGVELLRGILPAATSDHGVLFLDPRAITVDPAVVLFTGTIALVTGVLMGIVPAWRVSRSSEARVFREGATTARGFGSLRRPTLRGGLVVAEVGLAVTLLAGAGLMLHSLARLARIKPGFDPEGVLTFRYGLSPSDPRVSDAGFHQALLARFAALPGVQATAVTSCPPLSGCYDLNSVKRIEGQPPIPPAEQPMVRTHYVSDDFFHALGVPLVAGRTFGPNDRRGTVPVVVLSLGAARKLFGDSVPLGRSLSVSIPLTAGEGMAEVIGIVGDVRHGSLRENAISDLYGSLQQTPYDAPAVLLRTASDPRALEAPARAALLQLAPDVPLHEVTTLPQLVRQATVDERLVGWSLAAFAALAVVLAAIGVYGVLAYSVGQRRREIAVRMALGADRGTVLRLIMREGMTLVILGGTIGLAAALVTGQALNALLYGIAPRDPATLAAILTLLLVVAALATWFPARRASRIEPMTALRYE